MGEPAPSRAAPQQRLPLLDGLRGIAALGVFAFHLPMQFVIQPIFTRTYLMVDLFFLLSGFVLALAFEPKMAAGLDAIGFMRARLRRIWPTMALGTLIGAAVFSFSAPGDQIGWLLLYGLLVVPLTGGHRAIFPLNAPQWSLLWELAGNLLHVLLLRRLGERGLLAIALAGGACVIVSTLMLGSGGTGGVADNWYYAAPRLVWAYVLGIWFARRWQRARPRALADWRVALIAPLACLYGLEWLPLSLGVGDTLAIIVLLPGLFWVAVTASPPRTAAPLLAHLGAMSFPLYALHMPVLIGFAFISKGQLACIAAVVTTFALVALFLRIAPAAGAGFDRLVARLERMAEHRAALRAA